MSPIDLPVTKPKDMENYNLSNKEYKKVFLKETQSYKETQKGNLIKSGNQCMNKMRNLTKRKKSLKIQNK